MFSAAKSRRCHLRVSDTQNTKHMRLHLPLCPGQKQPGAGNLTRPRIATSHRDVVNHFASVSVILVMNASDLLVAQGVPDRTERQRQLWDATHERMERFLPGFLDEIIAPVPQPEPIPPPSPATNESPQNTP